MDNLDNENITDKKIKKLVDNYKKLWQTDEIYNPDEEEIKTEKY